MNKKELLKVKEVLNKIKNPDERVALAIAYVNKDLAAYAARKGQLIEQYDYGEWQY